MNREDIIRMAQEAGIEDWWDSGNEHREVLQEHLERFAALVASAEREVSVNALRTLNETYEIELRKAIATEREACAKVCEDLVPTYLKDGERWLKGRNGKPDSRLKDLAPNLEAAWEAEQLLKHGSVIEKITEVHICADAIRARGQA